MRRDFTLLGRDVRAVLGWVGRRRALVELPGALSHASPTDVRFVTQDVARFYAAFDEARRTRNFPAAFRSLYLASGSPGLREFAHRRPQGFANLGAIVRARRAFYETAREQVLSLAEDDAWKARALSAFRDLHARLPRARFPDVHLVVGGLFTGGTAGLSGLFLSAEFFADAADTRSLSAWERAAITSGDALPFLAAHELVHTLQRRSYSSVSSPSLLDLTIYEGTADFVASVVSDQAPRGAHHTFGRAHEADVWRAFRRDLLKSSVRDWLYQGPNARGVPADLGYFVGERIARSYFERTGDFAGLFDVSDPLALLRASGYDP
ncbi:DUF2268 domain-containing putative Zn-dependent protease [Deinococcus yavapaiensis]|uniref:Putative Zn-dependent protease DUF2268 n=1 Tax=Deinococcus yavapaiensis KR-236 TaxID=694435 RepID=A0A318SDB4_9DEIO|nr:DUF2268 domain-containing putative Zn-dependent protease [Deinococcus yavapaiensis]PYE50027.1 putative Zn-dependent protease DUF2268 [Deinococcus yavapaiensis KR-236]